MNTRKQLKNLLLSAVAATVGVSCVDNLAYRLGLFFDNRPSNTALGAGILGATAGIYLASLFLGRRTKSKSAEDSAHQIQEQATNTKI